MVVCRKPIPTTLKAGNLRTHISRCQVCMKRVQSQRCLWSVCSSFMNKLRNIWCYFYEKPWKKNMYRKLHVSTFPRSQQRKTEIYRHICFLQCALLTLHHCVFNERHLFTLALSISISKQATTLTKSLHELDAIPFRPSYVFLSLFIMPLSNIKCKYPVYFCLFYNQLSLTLKIIFCTSLQASLSVSTLFE